MRACDNKIIFNASVRVALIIGAMAGIVWAKMLPLGVCVILIVALIVLAGILTRHDHIKVQRGEDPL